MKSPGYIKCESARLSATEGLKYTEMDNKTENKQESINGHNVLRDLASASRQDKTQKSNRALQRPKQSRYLGHWQWKQKCKYTEGAKTILIMK